MIQRGKCYLCKSSVSVTPVLNLHDTKHYKCDYCGDYLLDSLDYSGIKKPEDKFKIACVLNEKRLKGFPGVALSDVTRKADLVCGLPQISVKELLELFPKSASEILNRTLLNLDRLAPSPFGIINMKVTSTPDNLHFFTENTKEFIHIVNELKNQGLVKTNSTMNEMAITITATGWKWIDKLKSSPVVSKQAFVAMWFDGSMNDIYEKGIKTAIEKAGYDPMRIDGKDFNNKICDEIIAEIKKSKFLIADFTGQRGGVYFEAGFAKGLDRPVIFTVNKENVENLHFDTRQYNHIIYEDAEDLHKQLYNRICATIN